MAVPEGGVDLRAADRAAKEAKKGMKNYKVWKKYLKKKPQHKEHNVGVANLKSGNHPLVAALERCGYHSIIMHHDATGVAQCGSYRPAFLDQLTVSDKTFNIRVPDETGFLLPADDENCMKDCSNFTTLATLRAIARDAKARDECLKVPFDGYMWKVVKKEERKNEGGAVIIALTRKRQPIVTEGFFEMFDEAQGVPYWQKYDGAVAVEGEYYYKPQKCHDVVEGTDYHVMTDKDAFTALGIASHTPFTTQEEWDQMCHNVLGWEVKVVSLFDAGDGWDGHNVNVQVTHGEGQVVDAVIPVRALRKEDAGDTALFLAEVGQFIWKAEMDLFPNKGHNERGKAIQPLVAEWTGIAYNFHNDERHFGDWDWAGDDDDEVLAELANLKPEIAAYIKAQVEAEADYAESGLGMD